ncbi:MAG: hypothetical protein V1929_08880 [bacterium]
MSVTRLRGSATNEPSSCGIRAATNWWLAHVDIVMPDDPDPAKCRLLGANIVPGVDLDGKVIKSGVAIRPPRYDNPVRELFMDCPDLPDVTEDAYKQLGERFDWSYILGILRPGRSRKWGETEGFACIELAEWLMRERGASLINSEYDAWRITLALAMAGKVRWRRSDVIYRPENAGFWCSSKPIDW